MKLIFQWSWLLGVALIAPLDLPAGGAIFNTNMVEIKRRHSSVIAGDQCFFRSSPVSSAPVLRKVPLGATLRVMRGWNSSKGEFWLHVQLDNSYILEQSNFPQRGWIHV